MGKIKKMWIVPGNFNPDGELDLTKLKGQGFVEIDLSKIEKPSISVNFDDPEHENKLNSFFEKVFNAPIIGYCSKCNGKGFDIFDISQEGEKYFGKKIICATCNGRGIIKER